MTGDNQEAFRLAFLRDLRRGEIRTGIVSAIPNLGLFVDLGGVDGLVSVAELSWTHISHPSEVAAVGDEVRVEVLDVDMDRQRISLSLKSQQPDPWRQFAADHPPGRTLPGTVTMLVPFGAFVRVADGVEGLVHLSELSDHDVASPELVVRVGDEVAVRVVETDFDRRRIALSMKQVAGSPGSGPGRPEPPEAAPGVP